MLRWLIIISLILVGGCAFSGYYLQVSGKLAQFQEEFQPGMKPTPVRLTKVQQGDLVRTVSAPGQVEPKTKVEISAQVSARIIALPFREGQDVKKGDVIVRLDGRDLAALLDSAKAQLRSEEARLEGAKAAFQNAQLDYNRKKELLDTKDISKAEFDQTEADYRRVVTNLTVAERSIDIARANIQRAEKDLENTIITAPFDGVITKLNAEVGELVVIGTLNNAGSVIMEVADLSVMLLNTRIDEANIAPVKVGYKARVYVNAYPDIPMTGTVEHIGLKRMVDKDGTAYFETDILIDKPKDLILRSGLTANADIQVETFRNILKVPSQSVLDRAIDDLPNDVTEANALVDRSKKFTRVVFTIKAGKAVPIPVKTGASDLTDTVITGGLDAGERVIIGPFKILETLKAEQRIVDEATQRDLSKVVAGNAESKPAPEKPIEKERLKDPIGNTGSK